MKRPLLLAAAFTSLLALGTALSSDFSWDKFRQLDERLPTPNAYRTASGAPGHAYWQQRVDYDIEVTLDDANQRIVGSERILYTNNSPDALTYLWVQLDPNIFSPESHAVSSSLAPDLDGEPTYGQIRSLLARRTFDGSCKVSAVVDGRGAPLPYTIVGTLMRVDLPAPLESGHATPFGIDWSYSINDSKLVRGRTGFEYFEDDGNYLYEIAQWFPRLAAYTDYTGWQNKQFIGSGEFTLEFGDYRVAITAPADHVVASTGVLQNPSEVLKPEWQERLDDAATSDRPLFIVTPEEALENESSRSEDTKTWVFAAENVRDFAFASSRKFIWDAVLHTVEGEDEGVWSMSYYPKEGEPLWSRYSTQSIVHTLDVYSEHTFPYPYPVAISVNGPVGGMEYPMICFNGPRPEDDGTYSKRTKYGLISVIIHEVGHNWFPMIVNSDERQWTWMDEGLNTFCQFLAESTWEDEYPSRRGEPKNIVGYMSSDEQVPIMTNSESLLQFGNKGYAKPATALNILRETVMGRELFDFAFKEYSRRWMFKRPEPADLFRTLEDASAVDLDWFWNGWFYSTDRSDIAIEDLTLYRVDTRDPDVEKRIQRDEREMEPITLTMARNASTPKRTDAWPELLDFYNEFDELAVTPEDRETFRKLIDDLKDEEKEALEIEVNFYVVQLRNVGGLVMPVILEVTYEDGSIEELRLPAEIWRRNAEQAEKLILSSQRIERIELDPYLETADADLTNNHWPPKIEEKRFKMKRREKSPNPMREALEQEEKDTAASAEGTSE